MASDGRHRSGRIAHRIAATKTANDRVCVLQREQRVVVIWGAYAGAYALIVLQVCLFLMNLRGLRKNSKGKEDQKIQ